MKWAINNCYQNISDLLFELLIEQLKLFVFSFSGNRLAYQIIP